MKTYWENGARKQGAFLAKYGVPKSALNWEEFQRDFLIASLRTQGTKLETISSSGEAWEKAADLIQWGTKSCSSHSSFRRKNFLKKNKIWNHGKRA